MTFESVRNNPELCEQVKAYCREKWEKVSGVFARTADRSVSAEQFPQTWVMLMKTPEGTRVTGFYQLEEKDRLTIHTELTPFITTLFVDPGMRGGKGFGEMILNHARGVLGSMGYDTAYLCTDHIGYYEQYGFEEIGLDLTDYGQPTKVYITDTLGDFRYEVFDRKHPMPDHTRLAVYGLQHEVQDNPAFLLWFLKNASVTGQYPKFFTVTAFRGERVAGAVNAMRSPEDSRSWYIGDLIVAEDCRGQGIADKMIRKVLTRIGRCAAGGETVCSYIEKDNEASRNLHRKLGFEDTGELKPFGELRFGENMTTWIREI